MKAVDQILDLFNKGLTIRQISFGLGLSEDQVQKIICDERKKNPDKWPYRKPGKPK